MSISAALGPEVTGSLAYLLKHAHLQLDVALTQALAPLGIDPRALGVLRVLAHREPTSQQEVAQLLGVDRTTMVALVDLLEGAGIVARRPSANDRRRNVVEVTASGAGVFERAEAIEEQVEQELLRDVEPETAVQLREALRVIVAG